MDFKSTWYDLYDRMHMVSVWPEGRRRIPNVFHCVRSLRCCAGRAAVLTAQAVDSASHRGPLFIDYSQGIWIISRPAHRRRDEHLLYLTSSFYEASESALSQVVGIKLIELLGTLH
jgi:hypothetical protein